MVNKKKLKKVKKSEKVLDNTYSNDYISSRKRENKAIEAKKIRAYNIKDASRQLNSEVDQETDLGNKVRQIAELKNIALGDMIEAIASHIIFSDTDYVAEI